MKQHFQTRLADGKTVQILAGLRQFSTRPMQIGQRGLAIPCPKPEDMHISLGNLDKALRFIEEFSPMEKELYAGYSNHVEFKNGEAISYLK